MFGVATLGTIHWKPFLVEMDGYFPLLPAITGYYMALPSYFFLFPAMSRYYRVLPGIITHYYLQLPAITR